MNKFPKMLYKFPGIEPIHGDHFATLIVNDEAEQEAAAQEGWEETTTNAKRRAEDPPPQPAPTPVVQVEQPQEVIPDNDAPDRDALKAEATALGLEFPKNVPTERLAEMVAEAKAKE